MIAINLDLLPDLKSPRNPEKPKNHLALCVMIYDIHTMIERFGFKYFFVFVIKNSARVKFAAYGDTPRWILSFS